MDIKNSRDAASEKYSVDEIASLLDMCLSQEQLNLIIIQTKNVAVLELALQVKWYYILQNKNQSIQFSVDSILELITTSNCDKTCNAVNLVLLIHTSDSSLKSLLEYIKSHCCNSKESTYISQKLLLVAINTCERLNEVDLFCEILGVDFIINLYFKIITNDWKELRNYFISNILVKYIKICMYHTTVSNVLSIILMNRDLYTLSCLIDSFLSANDDFMIKFCDFWFFLQENLLADSYHHKKVAMYILRKCIEHVSLNKLNCKDQSEIVCGRTSCPDEFIKSWSNFFVLLEVMEEKQLHLIMPSLALLDAVKNLHATWLLCLYKSVLAHTQNSVAFCGTLFVLQHESCQDVRFFQSVLKYLLPVLNKNEFCSSYLQVLGEVKSFVNKCSSDIFTILLEESLLITWIPAAMWLFYSNVLSSVKDVSSSFFEEFACKIKTLPHAYIRNGCFKLALNFICNSMSSGSPISFDYYLQVAMCLVNYNKGLFPLFLALTHDHINLYKVSNVIGNEISNWQNEGSISASKICAVIKIIGKEKLLLRKAFLLVKYRKINLQACDNVILNLCKSYIDSEEIIEYLYERINNITSNDNVNVLCEIVKYVDCNITGTKLSKKCTYILLNPEEFTTLEVRLAYSVYHLSFCANQDIIKTWKPNFLNPRSKTDTHICKSFLYVYCETISREQTNESIQDICLIFENVLDMQSESIAIDLFKYLKILTKHTYESGDVLSLLVKCFDELLKFKKTDNFKAGLKLYVESVVEDVAAGNQNFALHMLDKLKLLITENNVAACIIANCFRNKSEVQNLEIFVSLIVELLLYGDVYRKDKRVEYEVCKQVGSFMKDDAIYNPAYQETSIRTAAVLTVINTLKNSEVTNTRRETADKFALLLLQKYKIHYNRRHFSDSQIHLQKLRIMQALLLIHKQTHVERPNLIGLLVDSFCEENHQPSVKQLMQYLLIRLLQDDGDDGIAKIAEKVNSISHAHTSTIVAFIPVLVHVSRKKCEAFVEKVIDVLLPWTMGANFKLRVYSQVAIVKLHEISIRKSYKNITQKYDVTVTLVKSVLEANSKEILGVLQNDAQFFDHFDPNHHFSIETIYVDIPRLNSVSPTEWELFNLEEIPSNPYVKVRNLDRTFSDCTSYDKSFGSKQTENCENFCENVQRKIVAWKTMSDVGGENERKTADDLIVVTTLIESCANLGGLSRTCEIYGVKRMVVGDGKVVTSKEFKSLSMSSENWIDIVEVKVDDLRDYLIDARGKGYSIIGAEQTSESVKLNEYHFPRKCVLVLGNEKEGISPPLLPILDVCIEIPQFGLVRSLNVHVAGAILIWEYVKQRVVK